MGQRPATLEDLVTKAANPDRNFWQNRRVLLTGHTGFKGAWCALWLNALGAQVHGFALPPNTEPNLWQDLGSEELLASETIGDLADHDLLRDLVLQVKPQIVLHMAAQALVRPSFADPVRTIATNTMGTVHLLDALRGSQQLEAVLVITTDKVYANDDSKRDFVEDDPLGGHDPYSASKAAAELLTRSYAASFFDAGRVAVATARAGNVIGGGDWSLDRLVPDTWRAAQAGRPLLLRAPESTRPWQHVIEPLGGYLIYLERLVGDPSLTRSLNFGPRPGASLTVAAVAEAVGIALGADRPWLRDTEEHPPEMRTLSLDPSRARDAIGWEPRLDHAMAIAWTAEWYALHVAGRDPRTLCLEQIRRYEALA